MLRLQHSRGICVSNIPDTKKLPSPAGAQVGKCKERNIFMRTETFADVIQVEVLSEVDALVGEHVMHDSPEVYWQDSYANLRFDSASEALEALRDPYFQLFIPERERTGTVLAEVRAFPPYSTNLEDSLEVISRLSREGLHFHLRKDNGRWGAAFGQTPELWAETAPLAVCLAALRAKSLEVQVETSGFAG